MNFEPIQTSIVNQLTATFSAKSLPFQVAHLPDNDADYIKAVQKQIVFVAYTGSTSPGLTSTNPVIQERKVQFAVECFSRMLYGENGISVVADNVEKSLVGFKPLNCGRLYLVKDDIIRGQDHIWTHSFQFECTTILVQDDLSDPIVVPNLSTVTSKFQNAANSQDAANGSEQTVIPTT